MASVSVKQQIAGGWEILIAKAINHQQIHARKSAKAIGRVAKFYRDTVRFLAGNVKSVYVHAEGFGKFVPRIPLKGWRVDASLR